MNELSIHPRSLLAISDATPNSDSCFDFMVIEQEGQPPEKFVIASAQGHLCKIFQYTVDDSSTERYRRKFVSIVRFSRDILSLSFASVKTSQLFLFIVTREGRLWCFHGDDLATVGECRAEEKQYSVIHHRNGWE